MKENNASVKFRHWVLANAKLLRSCSFEMKNTNTNSISFNCTEPGQVEHAEAIRWGLKGCLIRVESGTVGAPDFCYYKNAPSYIVIHFPKGYTIINFDTWNLEKKRSKRKSLTFEKAKSIAWKTIKA